MKPFEYFEPRSVGEATQLLFDCGEKARILAGGIDLIPRMRKGDLEPRYVISIQKIPGLSDIATEEKGGITFGAMCRLRSIEATEAVQRAYPVLHEAVHQITSVQTKCMGTAVGNLCIATPASDVATALCALGAQVRIAGPKGERTKPIDEFYLGYRRTCLGRGEMVTGVLLPDPMPGTGMAFQNLLRTRADIAKVTVAASVVLRDGVCSRVRIGIGAAAPTVFRATKAEALLIGQAITPELIHEAGRAASAETRPITDVRSTAEYRKEMAGVLVGRVLNVALERASGRTRRRPL